MEAEETIAQLETALAEASAAPPAPATSAAPAASAVPNARGSSRPAVRVRENARDHCARMFVLVAKTPCLCVRVCVRVPKHVWFLPTSGPAHNDGCGVFLGPGARRAQARVSCVVVASAPMLLGRPPDRWTYVGGGEVRPPPCTGRARGARAAAPALAGTVRRVAPFPLPGAPSLFACADRVQTCSPVLDVGVLWTGAPVTSGCVGPGTPSVGLHAAKPT
jgi:hypothetical protein